MISDDRNFIALVVRGSVTHSHIVISRFALESVCLTASGSNDMGSPMLYLDFCFSSVMPSVNSTISIVFNASTNLQDGLDLYRELMLQLGFPSSIARQDSSVLVPPQLRHLLAAKPDETGRP